MRDGNVSNGNRKAEAESLIIMRQVVLREGGSDLCYRKVIEKSLQTKPWGISN